MPTSPETLSKVKNLLRKMDQSIDNARTRRLTANSGPAPASQPSFAHPSSPAPASHPLQAAAPGSNPIRARAMARPILQQRPAV